MQIIYTSLQTDNHASTSALSITGWMPFLPANQQRQSTVHAVKGKWVELSTPKLVGIQCMTCIQREVKGQGHMVIECTAGMGLQVDMTA